MLDCITDIVRLQRHGTGLETTITKSGQHCLMHTFCRCCPCMA